MVLQTRFICIILTCCQQIMVLKTRWSLMAGVSQDRFYCSSLLGIRYTYKLLILIYSGKPYIIYTCRLLYHQKHCVVHLYTSRWRCTVFLGLAQSQKTVILKKKKSSGSPKNLSGKFYWWGQWTLAFLNITLIQFRIIHIYLWIVSVLICLDRFLL